MLTGRSGNEKRYLGGWVGVEWGETSAVMGLPKTITGSIIMAWDSANEVLTYTEIQNGYSEINSIWLECFSFLLQMCLWCQLKCSLVIFEGVKSNRHANIDTFENSFQMCQKFCVRTCIYKLQILICCPHEWKAFELIHIMAGHMTSRVVLCATHLHNYHDTYVFTSGENQGVLACDAFFWVFIP